MARKGPLMGSVRIPDCKPSMARIPSTGGSWQNISRRLHGSKRKTASLQQIFIHRHLLHHQKYRVISTNLPPNIITMFPLLQIYNKIPTDFYLSSHYYLIMNYGVLHFMSLGFGCRYELFQTPL